MNLTLAEILQSPDYFAFEINPHNFNIQFKQVYEQCYKSSIFLDERITHTTGLEFEANFDDIYQFFIHKKTVNLTSHFLFHTSFCCSTLLARCYEPITDILVLKEPWLFRRLSDIKRRNQFTQEISSSKFNQLIFVMYHLFNKSYGESRLLFKPSNLANNLIAELMSQNQSSKSIILYNSLEEFLISNLKKATETQLKMPLLAKIFTRDSGLNLDISLDEIEKLPLLKACSILWFSQIELIRMQIDTELMPRCTFLNAADFMYNPLPVLRKTQQFMGLHRTQKAEKKSFDLVLNTHAKTNDINYSPSKRFAEAQVIKQKYQLEISSAMNWSQRYFDHQKINDFLNSVSGFFRIHNSKL